MSVRPGRLVAAALAVGLVLLPLLASATVPGSFTAAAHPACPLPPCLRWEVHQQAPDGPSRFHDAVLSHDGRVAYFVGAYHTHTTGSDLITMAVAVPTGQVLWKSRYDGPSSSSEGDVQNVESRHLALTPDGSKLVVATSSITYGQGLDMVTIAYQASNGTQLWASRYNGPASRNDRVAGVDVDAQGHVVTAGTTEDAQGFGSWAVLGHDLATGARTWSRIFTNPCNQERAFGVALAGGQAIVGGMATDCLVVEGPLGPVTRSRGFQLTAAALDPATGALLWRTAQGDPLAPGAASASRGNLAVAGGRIFVVGGLTHATNPEGDLDVFMMATDAAGNALWTQRHDGGGYDMAVGATATPDGARLLVTATTPGLGTGGVTDQNPDFIALSFDGATGTRQWLTRFDDAPDSPGLGGVTLAGTATEFTNLVQPALFGDNAMVIGWSSQRMPTVDELGGYGDRLHHVAVLDTSTGAVRHARQETDAWGEVFAALPGLPSFVAAGYRGTLAASDGLVRHFSLDVTPPTLRHPALVAAAAAGPQGATVSFGVVAEDDHAGATVRCTPASGSTFPLGSTVVQCVATDLAGNTATAQFAVAVTYAWSGFLGETQDGVVIRNRPADVAFQLTGASAQATNAHATLWVAPVTDAGVGPEVAAQPHQGTGNTFRYSAGTGTYEYKWDTNSIARGDYQVRIDLGDGVARTARLTIA